MSFLAICVPQGWDADSLHDDVTDVLGDKPSTPSSTDIIVVWITSPAIEEAKKLAQLLVEQKYAACVNILPGLESIYMWEGKIDQSSEVLLMVKTRASLLDSLTSFVILHHSYTVPETIAASVIGGNTNYLEWVRENTDR